MYKTVFEFYLWQFSWWRKMYKTETVCVSFLDEKKCTKVCLRTVYGSCLGEEKWTKVCLSIVYGSFLGERFLNLWINWYFRLCCLICVFSAANTRPRVSGGGKLMSPSLALDPIFGFHSQKTIHTAQPFHPLKPSRKPSSSHSIFIATNISTQFLLQSLCVCVCVCV